MYVCVYISIYTCVYIYMFVYICMYIYVYIYMHIKHECVCMCIDMHIYMCVCIHIYVYIYIYIYIKSVCLWPNYWENGICLHERFYDKLSLDLPANQKEIGFECLPRRELWIHFDYHKFSDLTQTATVISLVSCSLEMKKKMKTFLRG